MARPHVQIDHVLDVEPRTVGDGPLGGAARRLLSEDGGSGAWTGVVDLPAGFTSELAFDGPVELLVLSGALELDGRAVPRRYHAVAPPGARAPLASAEGARALVMVDDVREAVAGESVQVTDPWAMPFSAPTLSDQIPAGILIKLLRVDPVTGDWSWISACVPEWRSPLAERHPMVQEGLMLRGDMFSTEGTRHAGGYFWRPGMVLHGPMVTRDGALFFFRSKGGSLTVEYEEVPGWADAVERYLAERPYGPPERPLDELL